MAEIRKHNPSSSAIGDAVRSALGEDIRPVTPRTREVTDAKDPFAPAEHASQVTFTAAAAGGESSGTWFAVRRDAPPSDSAAAD